MKIGDCVVNINIDVKKVLENAKIFKEGDLDEFFAKQDEYSMIIIRKGLAEINEALGRVVK